MSIIAICVFDFNTVSYSGLTCGNQLLHSIFLLLRETKMFEMFLSHFFVEKHRFSLSLCWCPLVVTYLPLGQRLSRSLSSRYDAAGYRACLSVMFWMETTGKHTTCRLCCPRPIYFPLCSELHVCIIFGVLFYFWLSFHNPCNSVAMLYNCLLGWHKPII